MPNGMPALTAAEEDKPKKRKRGRPRKEKEVVEDAVLVEDEDTPMNGLLMPLN